MATDYDASRKTEEEQKEESLEARRLASGDQDKTSGKVDEDEAEAAEAYELPGADLSHEFLDIEVTPKQSDEFTCDACFLVQHFGIVDPVGNALRIEDHGGGDDGTGERPPPGLVASRDRTAVQLQLGRLQFEGRSRSCLCGCFPHRRRRSAGL